MDIQRMEGLATKARYLSLEAGFNAGQAHTGADLSEIDILMALYDNILHYSKDDFDNVPHDHFILSKGHGVGGYYAVLSVLGLLDENEYKYNYMGFDNQVPGHPMRHKTPFIEASTGALGHGLPLGIGLALSAKLKENNLFTYILTGDGELEEGSNWEAGLQAGAKKLDNLFWIIDRNRLQLADFTENISLINPLEDKLSSFNFEVCSIDGHNIEEIVNTINKLKLSKNGKPKAIVANTIKGKGVSFIENNPVWHHKIVTEKELQIAKKELFNV